MDQPDNSVLYIRFRKRTALNPDEPIRLSQIAQLLTGPEWDHKLKSLIIRQPGPLDGNMLLIDILEVIRAIKAVAPHLVIEHYGEPHALVEIAAKPKPPRLVLVVLVWLVLFIGSGLAIMNFHADVSMLKVHQRIYELLTGRQSERPYFLQIPYSLGIGIGMVLFFNHLFKKKFNEEPSPLEVEMFLYQENMNHYIITEEYMKLQGKKDAEAHVDNRS
ncbi:stage V sporulation protein AA [Paenibacillus sp. CC-CFT747]|nr:stage V sporulation protein AA [Paenibacillus sp. CC-CFT747]